VKQYQRMSPYVRLQRAKNSLLSSLLTECAEFGAFETTFGSSHSLTSSNVTHVVVIIDTCREIISIGTHY
jgi:hypothetical protein